MRTCNKLKLEMIKQATSTIAFSFQRGNVYIILVKKQLETFKREFISYFC